MSNRFHQKVVGSATTMAIDLHDRPVGDGTPWIG
jgi:hypothetical protein